MFRVVLVILCGGLAAAQQADTGVLRQAVARHQAGDYQGAIALYQSFLKAHPEMAGVRSNLGAALAHEGRFEEAIQEYNLALEAEPGNAKARLNLALAEYKTGRIRWAAGDLEKVHAAEPDNRQATLLLAECDLRIGAYKKTVELLEHAGNQPGTVGDGDLAVAYLLGTALIRDGQIERGQPLIDRILKNGDSAEARLLLGSSEMIGHNFKGAQADLARAVELNPKLPGAHSYLGLALLRMGDTDGAEKAFRAELQIEPNDFDACLQLGGILRQNQNYGEARTMLERAARVRPGDFSTRYQLAALDLEQGRVEQARAALEKLTQEAPNFVQAHVSLASAYYRLKRKDDGDREREKIRVLNAAAQAKQPGVPPEAPAAQ